MTNNLVQASNVVSSQSILFAYNYGIQFQVSVCSVYGTCVKVLYLLHTLWPVHNSSSSSSVSIDI